MKVLRIITLTGLVLSAALLAAVTVWQQQNVDESIPVIQCPETPLVVSLGQEEGLLADVTASDGKDGDLTGQLLVQSIEKGEGGTAVVTYAVADSDHHVVTRTRPVEYTDYVPPRFALERELRYTPGALIRVRDRLTARDVLDGDISSRIKMTSSTTVYDEGTYPVTFQVTNSLGDTSTITLDVVVRNYVSGEPRITLEEYLIYLEEGERFDPLAYVSAVSGGVGEVTAQLPSGGLSRGVNQVTYRCAGTGETEGTATLYVVKE